MTVKIAASPPDSEILLDGAKLDTNPFTGQFPKDTALHRLELRCVGRVTEARMIRLDQDLDLLIALPIDKASQVRSGSAAAAAAWAKSRRPISSARRSQARPVRLPRRSLLPSEHRSVTESRQPRRARSTTPTRTPSERGNAATTALREPGLALQRAAKQRREVRGQAAWRRLEHRYEL